MSAAVKHLLVKGGKRATSSPSRIALGLLMGQQQVLLSHLCDVARVKWHGIPVTLKPVIHQEISRVGAHVVLDLPAWYRVEADHPVGIELDEEAQGGAAATVVVEVAQPPVTGVDIEVVSLARIPIGPLFVRLGPVTLRNCVFPILMYSILWFRRSLRAL